MGWTLQSRDTKDCGCVEETRVHDDFPTSDTTITLCKECETKQVEKKKRREEEQTELYNKFIQALKNTETKLVPRKNVYQVIFAHRFRFRGSSSVLNNRLSYDMFKYQKIKNRYYIDINAVQLFYAHELDRYYLLDIN